MIKAFGPNGIVNYSTPVPRVNKSSKPKNDENPRSSKDDMVEECVSENLSSSDSEIGDVDDAQETTKRLKIVI